MFQTILGCVLFGIGWERFSCCIPLMKLLEINKVSLKKKKMARVRMIAVDHSLPLGVRVHMGACLHGKREEQRTEKVSSVRRVSMEMRKGIWLVMALAWAN